MLKIILFIIGVLIGVWLYIQFGGTYEKLCSIIVNIACITTVTIWIYEDIKKKKWS